MEWVTVHSMLWFLGSVQFIIRSCQFEFTMFSVMFRRCWTISDGRYIANLCLGLVFLGETNFRDCNAIWHWLESFTCVVTYQTWIHLVDDKRNTIRALPPHVPDLTVRCLPRLSSIHGALSSSLRSSRCRLHCASAYWRNLAGPCTKVCSVLPLTLKLSSFCVHMRRAGNTAALHILRNKMRQGLLLRHGWGLVQWAHKIVDHDVYIQWDTSLVFRIYLSKLVYVHSFLQARYPTQKGPVWWIQCMRIPSGYRISYSRIPSSVDFLR